MNEFIFGHSPIERIVAVEVKGAALHVFREGDQDALIVKSPQWLLCDKQLDSSWLKLDGELHYGYIKTFASQNEAWRYRRNHARADFYQVYDEREAAAIISGFTYNKGLKCADVSVLAFDIESTTLEHNADARVLLISNTFRAPNGTVERKLFAYEEYETPAGLFEAWTDWVQEKNPSIVCGHNIFGYDLPYLDFCASRVGAQLCLGRDGSALRFNNYESKYRRDGSQFYTYRGANIFGRQIVDTFFLSMKFDIARKFTNYGLKTIIKELGLEVKDRQFYDASKIAQNYEIPAERELIKAYALHDADDALALWDRMGAAYFYLAQSVPKSLQQIVCTASGSWLNSFLVRSYIQINHSIPKPSPEQKFEGAISIGNPGIYKNVFKVDVASLYPSIMLQFEVYDREKDPNGHFLKMVDYFTNERLVNKRLSKETKDAYYSDLEQAQKVFINSAYGMLGTPGLNFNSPHNGARVTEEGRKLLTMAMDWARALSFDIVNADTDSISITNKGMSWSEAGKGAILEQLNRLSPQKIRWEDDGVYERVLVLKAKNYVLEAGGKRKTKGAAAKATYKEPALREFIDRMITALFVGSDVVSLYNEYIVEIMRLKDINRWSFKRTVTDAVLHSDRTNEAKVRDALEATDFQMGDKLYFYFVQDDNKSMKLATEWAGDHNLNALLKKLWDTAQIFSTVVDTSKFPNYSLKRKNRPELNALLSSY